MILPCSCSLGGDRESSWKNGTEALHLLRFVLTPGSASEALSSPLPSGSQSSGHEL